MNQKLYFKIIMGIVVTVVTVAFAVKSLGTLNPAALLSLKINWWMAGLSAALFALSTFFRGLVYPCAIDKNIGILNAWRIIAVGNAANMILPLRLGEGVRLAMFPRGYSAVERAKLTLIPAVADFAVIFFLSLIAVFAAGFNNPNVMRFFKTVSLIFIIICMLAGVIFFSLHETKKDTLSYFNQATLKMTCWVFISWILILVSIYFGLAAFGFSFTRSIRLTLAAFAGMNLIMLIPSSPGGIGLFEYSVIVGLSGLGIPMDTAKLAGILLHLIQFAALLPMGLILYLSGIRASFEKKPKASRPKTLHLKNTHDFRPVFKK